MNLRSAKDADARPEAGRGARCFLRGALDTAAVLRELLKSAKDADARIIEIFRVFLKLGCTSFGGPIAHLGYFRAELVQRRAWLSDESFAEIVALAQSLPGPASSQVGFSIGMIRGGLTGALAAWLGFTLPSAVLMISFAFAGSLFTGKAVAGFFHGLQLVAVAVVSQAVLAMRRSLAPDRERFAVALVAAGIALFAPSSIATVVAIFAGALAGVAFPGMKIANSSAGAPLISITRRQGMVALSLFFSCFVVSLSIPVNHLGRADLFVSFFRAGSLVFGGGHVVLPLLNDLITARGWITPERFLSGYGAAQALPGPLFTFAAYLGAAVRPNPNPVLYAFISLIAIFLPGLLLVTGVLPFWSELRQRYRVRAALRGINAAVVGVLAAALYDPIWVHTIYSRLDFYMALFAFVLLAQWKLQPWMVVLLSGCLGMLLR